MNLSDLLNKDLVEKFQSDPQQIKDETDIAKNDLSSAKKMLDIELWGWSHNASYNAMLQAGRALMFYKGYRPKSKEHHLAVVSFIQAVFPTKFEPEVLQAFAKARLRRNESMYDRAGLVSETQARNLVEKAEILVTRAIEILQK